MLATSNTAAFCFMPIPLLTQNAQSAFTGIADQPSASSSVGCRRRWDTRDDTTDVKRRFGMNKPASEHIGRNQGSVKLPLSVDWPALPSACIRGSCEV